MPILCVLLANMKISLILCNCADSWTDAAFEAKLLFGYWMICSCSSTLTGMSLFCVCMCVCVRATASQLGDNTGYPNMDQWQLGGIADEHYVGGNSVIEGVVQMPLDKLPITWATKNIFGSRKVQMMVVLIPG